MLLYAENERALPGSVDGIDQSIVDYHREILGQSGLIDLDGVTVEGNDLLCHIKCHVQWNRIKVFAAEKNIGLTTDFIQIISSRLMSFC